MVAAWIGIGMLWHPSPDTLPGRTRVGDRDQACDQALVKKIAEQPHRLALLQQ